MTSAEKNRRAWNEWSSEYQATHRSQLKTTEPCWGVWAIPEAKLNVLGDVTNKEVLEYGCGGAQWSICLAKRGARVTGLDLSELQLEYARELVAENGVAVELVQANGEQTPFGDASFDIVFCDHGVMSWADPFKTVPEVARILRSGGLFAFNMTTPIADLCWDNEKFLGELSVPYFGMHRFEDAKSVSFNLPYGEWLRLFQRYGLQVLDLLELQAPEHATTTYDFVPPEWAHKYPAEHIWKLIKTTGG